ncbi:uncharacterized protein LOC135095886 [Scylla paramamosain]|uniref:uncharacterized protein LOC135095886 n=1 Tax=Scylla paramamosain TaxID=85552 RepID=UPI0030835D7D
MPHSTLQCHFENLYYSPVYQEFAFVLGKDSALEGVDSVEALQNRLHLSTALGHNGFLFHVTAVPRDAVQGEVWSLDHHTLVMARFKPDNLFHVLHDDVNEDVGNTRTHPHYPPHFGGIQHLPQEERRRVVSSLRGDKLVNVTCCMDVDWLYRIYQDTVVRLHAHGDAHGHAHEAHTRTNTHRRTRTNALEVNAHRNAHRATREADTHTDAHRDPDAHTDAHEGVLKSVPFSVMLREGLSSLHSSPQSPPLQSSPQPLLQSSLGSSHTLNIYNLATPNKEKCNLATPNKEKCNLATPNREKM